MLEDTALGGSARISDGSGAAEQMAGQDFIYKPPTAAAPESAWAIRAYDTDGRQAELETLTSLRARILAARWTLHGADADLPSVFVGRSMSDEALDYSQAGSSTLSVTSSACGHSLHKEGEGDGFCYGCHMEQLHTQEDHLEAHEWGSSDLKPLRSSLRKRTSSESSLQKPRSVTFCEEVELFETYASSEYAARSMNAPNDMDEEDLAAEARRRAIDAQWAAKAAPPPMSVRIAGGALPNLRAFW